MMNETSRPVLLTLLILKGVPCQCDRQINNQEYAVKGWTRCEDKTSDESMLLIRQRIMMNNLCMHACTCQTVSDA